MDKILSGKSVANLLNLCNSTFLYILKSSAFSTVYKLKPETNPVEVTQDDILARALHDMKSCNVYKVSETLLIGVLTLDYCELMNFLIIVVSGREVHL